MINFKNIIKKENIDTKFIDEIKKYILLNNKGNSQFYGYFLMNCKIEENYSLPTLAMNMKENAIYLWYNPEFLLFTINKAKKENKTNSEIMNLISELFMHELLHAVFMHPTRLKSEKNHNIKNIAMDMEVNSYLPAIANFLKEMIVTPDKYGAKPNLSCETYHKYLKENMPKQQQQQQQSSSNSNSQSNSSNSNQQSQNKSQFNSQTNSNYQSPFQADSNQQSQNKSQYQGNSNSQSNANPQQQRKNTNSQSNSQSSNQQQSSSNSNSPSNSQTTSKSPNPNQGETFDSHDWKNWTDAQKRQFKQKMKHIINKIRSQMPGKMPGNLEKIYKKELYTDVAWKSLLKKYITRGLIKDKINYSWKYTNRRNINNMGSKFTKKGKLIVAVDTSGSMSNSLLNRVMGNINNLLKQKWTADLIQFDYEVQKIDKNLKKLPDKYKIIGRGGTSFINLFKRIEKEYKISEIKRSVVIVMTDGEADFPKNLAYANKLVWIIFNSYKIKPKIGKSVYINNND